MKKQKAIENIGLLLTIITAFFFKTNSLHVSKFNDFEHACFQEQMHKLHVLST